MPRDSKYDFWSLFLGVFPIVVFLVTILVYKGLLTSYFNSKAMSVGVDKNYSNIQILKNVQLHECPNNQYSVLFLAMNDKGQPALVRACCLLVEGCLITKDQ